MALALLTLLPALAALAAAPAEADSVHLQGAGLPSPRQGTSAVWTGTHAYVFGGRDFSYTNQIVRYDPATDGAVVMGARLPVNIAWTSAVWNGQYAFIFGGTYLWGGYTYHSNVILRYDPANDTLQTMPTRLFEPLSETTAVYDGARYAYILGGFSSWGYRDVIYRYDTQNDTLTDWARLPSGRSGMAGVWANNSVYAMGGINQCSGGVCNAVEEIVRYEPAVHQVTDLGVYWPNGNAYPSAAFDGTYAYVLGGWGADGGHAFIDRFDPTTHAMHRMGATMPFGRYDASSVWGNGQAFTFGGKTVEGWRTGEILRYNLSAPSAPVDVAAKAGPGTGNVTVSWAAHHAHGSPTYQLYRRVAGGAETLLATVPGNATSYLDTGLRTGATYTYSLTVTDAGHVSPRSASASVVPLDVRFADDMESGPSRWNVTDASGPGTWEITTHRAASPTRSFGIGGPAGYGNLSSDALQLAGPVDLTRLAANSATLTLKHHATGERTCLLTCLLQDYGRVQASGDGGATWTTLKDGIHTTSGAWVTESFNLEAFRGGHVLVRFAWASDAAFAYDGWFIDDVSIHGHANEAPNATLYLMATGATAYGNATGSNDPDGDALTYAWDWGDGTTGSGVTASRTYAATGVYTVRLTVTDSRGASTSVAWHVSAVAPGQANAFLDTMDHHGATWNLTGSWAHTRARSASPNASFATAGYGPHAADALQTASPIGLSALVADKPATLRFRHQASGERACDLLGACTPVDFGRVQASGDGGATWDTLLDGVTQTAGWETRLLDVSAYHGRPLHLRFLWVSDGANASDGWAVDDVQVFGTSNRAPVAAFTAPNQGRVVYGNATATADPDGDAMTYAWDWGDGTANGASTSPYAAHTYALDASYLVKMTASDGRGGVAAKTLRASAMQPWMRLAFLDDMESGPAAWTVTDQGGLGGWAPTTARAFSGTTSFAIVGQTGTLAGDDSIVATVDLANASGATLDFRHLAKGGYTRSGSTYVPSDWGRVSVSTDGGATWTVVKDQMFLTNDLWRRERVDLAPAAGHQALLRFQWLSTSSDAGQGWWIDDVQVIANGNRLPNVTMSLPTGTTFLANASGTTDADGDNLTYEWTWGDGTATPASRNATVTKTYAKPGIYAVTLTVRDGKDAVTKRVDHAVVPSGERVLLADALEAGFLRWNTPATSTNAWVFTQWRSHTPANSLYVGGSAPSLAAGRWSIETTQPLDLGNLSGATLRYHGWVAGRAGTCTPLVCDEVYLVAEASTDGGLTWSEVAGSRVHATPTPAQYTTGEAYAADLGAYAGQANVLLRLTWVTTGAGTSIPYAYVDDLLLHGTPTP